MAALRGLIAAAALLLPADAAAQEWSLFRRTPREQARDLATDRPDRTESPYSVPAGWFQVEASAVAWSRDRAGGATTRTLGVGQLNVKAGLLPDVDLQFVTEAWSRETVRGSDGAQIARASGVGIVQGRLKVNLWGNDGGRTAFGVMPFAGTVREDAVPGGRERHRALAGVLLPFALDLGRDWSLGAMLELDLAEDAAGVWRGTWIQTLTVGRPVTGNLSAFGEVFHGSGAGEREVTADAGLTYAIGDDVQLDGGAFVGLTEAAAGVSPFLGISFRF